MPSQLCLVCAGRKSGQAHAHSQTPTSQPFAPREGIISAHPAPLPRSISPVASQQPHRHKERNKREAEPSYKLEHIWRRNKLPPPPPPPGADAPWEARLRGARQKKKPSALSRLGAFPARMERIISFSIRPSAPNTRNATLGKGGRAAARASHAPTGEAAGSSLSRRRPPEGWAGWAG